MIIMLLSRALVGSNLVAQCDERKPSCTGCTKRNLPCHYERRFISSEAKDGGAEPHRQLDQPEEIGRDALTTTNEPTSAYPTPPSGRLSSPLSLRALGSLSPASTYGDNDGSRRGSSPRHETLNSTDLDLLQHYLSHTARTTAWDVEDYYALQIGIPNLAVRSKPLMSSMLALAACCKSSDILSLPGTLLPHYRDLVQVLLTLADRHHQDSLHQIQADLSRRTTEDYEHALANATLMVLYGSASQCVRIRLREKMISRGDDVPNDLVPTQSQWISLIRACQAAYSGLLNDQPQITVHSERRTRKEKRLSPTNGPAAVVDDDDSPRACGQGYICPEDGPTQSTKDLFFPILMSTSSRALERLFSNPYMAAMARTERSCTMEHTELGDAFEDLHLHPIVHSPDLQACYAALKVLDEIFVEVFHTRAASPHSSAESPLSNTNASAGEQYRALGQLGQVAPWLQKYASRVTAATSTRPLRRTVMAFLHWVPSQYLTLVQTNLDLIRDAVEPSHFGTVQDNLSYAPNSPNSCTEQSEAFVAQQLAIDIFAHWLVLVMLLDGVWWIGGIGSWELGRVVAAMRSQGWPNYHHQRHSHNHFNAYMPGENFGVDLDRSRLKEDDASWWPESMHKVALELVKQTTAGR